MTGDKDTESELAQDLEATDEEAENVKGGQLVGGGGGGLEAGGKERRRHHRRHQRHGK